MSRLLLLWLLLLTHFTVADQVKVEFRVDPPDAEVYRLGSSRDVQNGQAVRLCIAQDGWIADRQNDLSDKMTFVFKAEGYQDHQETFNLTNAMNESPITIPVENDTIKLESQAKNYIPHALVLMGIAIGSGGFFFLRARNKRVQDIGSWVESNLVPAPDEDPLLGKRIGDFWLLERLGRGGMATVYRGVKEEEREGEQYAIKIVHPHVLESADFKKRFHREVVIGDKLLHPNIVTVFQGGEFEGQYYIALEYLGGGDLRGRLPENGFELKKALEYAIPIFDAVAYAHKRDIVHRDLKPENVLISSDDRLKLSDFGLARSRNFSTVTVTGSVMGTPGYIAPEQMTEGGPNPASDQYALGVVLFELATGRLPFDGDDPMQILFRHIQETPPAPSSLKADLPPEFDRIVSRMLAKAPKERYPSVADAREALLKLKGSME